jgi:hypothetical protein
MVLSKCLRKKEMWFFIFSSRKGEGKGKSGWRPSFAPLGTLALMRGRGEGGLFAFHRFNGFPKIIIGKLAVTRGHGWS